MGIVKTHHILCSTRKNCYVSIACFLLVTWVIGNFLIGAQTNSAAAQMENTKETDRQLPGVCPPFYLLDEEGNIIDPVKGVNADKPYSPKQTCGKCHDYDKITQGFHFQQGADEKPTQDQSDRCQWASTPGNYGGTWCSPAPLYSYLSPKKNETSVAMDMTSQSFITIGCADCHPGGGPMEFDREGKRYDLWMKNPESGLVSGGENNLDGDYYKTTWDRTGVLEADCLLCHLPEYNFGLRKKQLAAANYRWAPSAAAGIASVSGSITAQESVQVSYDSSKFNPDGTISLHIVREPRNETCLQCHAKPGWKKRGANFNSRTDVHLRAGLKCVDCHPAGQSAQDPRIKGNEIHQFGKGDDPGGQARNDLDNTCRSCEECHSTGYLGAPIATHSWLPPLHLDKIACQTCHIPERAVKSAQFQASDAFNPGPRIPTKGKHLWTFYGPDMKYWNHYGELETMGYEDKPTDPFRPALTVYKEKIYPVNRVHSAWPGIETEGGKGLMQPKMSDIYKMWIDHRSDPAKYPELSKIKDNTDDGAIEINAPEEIDALIAAVTQMLSNIKYPMTGKRVVWVMDNRVYSSGTQYREIPLHEWEASPYANVHKYSHDVYPAKSALGSQGCTHCHAPQADFFFASAFKHPFDNEGNPIVEPQYVLLGLGKSDVLPGVWREAYVKPVYYVTIVFALFSLLVYSLKRRLSNIPYFNSQSNWMRYVPYAVFLFAGIGFSVLLTQPLLIQYMFPSRFWLDSQHFLIAVGVIGLGITAYLRTTNLPIQENVSFFNIFPKAILVSTVFVAFSGGLMLLKIPGLGKLSRYAYTVFDLALIGILIGVIGIFLFINVEEERSEHHS